MSSATGAPASRLPGPGLDLDALFQVETKRRVQRDHTVNCRHLVRDRCRSGRSHRHPALSPSVPVSRGVEVWSEGKFIERARVLDAYANCFVRRNHGSKNIHTNSAAPPRSSSMSLRDLHELRPGSGGKKSSEKNKESR